MTIDKQNECVERIMADHDVATAALRDASPMSDRTVIGYNMSEGDFVRSSG
jgi:hypothetical protein